MSIGPEQSAMEVDPILLEASQIINGVREGQYGKAENSFAIIAEFWSTYLDYTITSVQVAMMMSLLKIARTKNMPTHKDSFVDLAGYAALGYRCAND